jgi:hypothetical protein
MKRTPFVLLACATILLPGCSQKTEGTDASATQVPSASASVAAPATGTTAGAAATASATAHRPFAGKLTVAMVRGYQVSASPSDPFDATIAAVAQHLGPPTRKENKTAYWAAADAEQCSSLSFAEGGAGSGPSRDVAKKDFGEQWGRFCLLMAGVSPPRKPFSDKVLTPSAFGKQPSWHQVRVEGLLGEVRWQQGASRYSFTLVDAQVPTSQSDCSMEMGAAPPKAAPKSRIVVECDTGSGSSTGSSLSECFLVEK